MQFPLTPNNNKRIFIMLVQNSLVFHQYYIFCGMLQQQQQWCKYVRIQYLILLLLQLQATILGHYEEYSAIAFAKLLILSIVIRLQILNNRYFSGDSVCVISLTTLQFILSHIYVLIVISQIQYISSCNIYHVVNTQKFPR